MLSRKNWHLLPPLSRYHRQSLLAKAAARVAWEPRKLLFDKQIAVFDDPSRLRVVDGSRRSGKSYFASIALLDTALTIPGSRSLFLALTRDDAKELVWDELCSLNRQFSLGFTVNEVRLEMTHPNGSHIRCGGAKDRRQAERRRGRFYHLVIIDECQLFPSHLRDLVESILKPALLGRGGRGRIVLMGTPAEVPGVGYWEERVLDRRWSQHAWTLRNNPWLGTDTEIEAFLVEMAEGYELYGGREGSRFQREYEGKRPPPENVDRPYQYDPRRNDWDAVVKEHEEDRKKRTSFTRWELPLGGTWKFIFGIDIGSRAASAIAVSGVTTAAPGKIWHVEEFIAPRLLPDVLRAKIDERRAIYHPLVMAVDEGDLGRMICDQWRAPPYFLPVTAADKTAPEVNADFVSAAMNRGDYMIPKGSYLAQDMAVMRWDEESLRLRGRRKVAKEPHSDIEPAARYSFKDAHALAQATRAQAPAIILSAEDREAANLLLERKGESAQGQKHVGRREFAGARRLFR